ncbi:Rossmann-fold NAD(P)-binding domain-containing protein [Sediminicola luteus]|uniref:Nucleoside-diphosphate sugar epimerase n=1 Tax=Sediminicola luteus TaxID=319238 RepID=A0A2A4G4J2_9FLAO|nr:nucleoside-diphosphate sugar epimerase [Sediminicola luteus]PCE62884.1 nucleoside-diphosphate sugar epimerase [Sediminicola luteus]
MESASKTAIILGATGLTGGLLLTRLLADGSFGKILSFSRRPVGFKHPKLQEHILDVLKLNEQAELFYADMVFCCIGTTRKKTPDKTLYRAIDLGIPQQAALLCQRNRIETFMVISALGANPDSWFFYNRLKGEMETGVLQAQIPHTYILQPSLILGPRQEQRWGEKIGAVLSKAGQFLMIGPFKKYRPIAAETIAACMHFLALNPYPIDRMASDKIAAIGKKY